MLQNNAHHQRCTCLKARRQILQIAESLAAEEAKMTPCQAKRHLQGIIDSLRLQADALQEGVTAGNDYYAEEGKPDASADG